MVGSILIHLLITFGIVLGCLGTAVNPLNGQHLRILATEFPLALVTKRNATGHIVHIDGIQINLLESLSRMLNFSYSFLPVVAPNFDDSPQAKGIAYYLLQDEADFSLSNSIITPSHFQQADFPTNWWYGSFSTLVPYPRDESLNLAAGLKPFSYEVWITIAVSAFAIILCLKLLLKKRNQVKDTNNFHNIVIYVMGNLASQGQHFFPKRLVVRVVAGAWCCGCFFLVQSYSSTLISHLTSPNEKPIVNSFFDVADTPGVGVGIDKGFALDVFLRITESEHVKRFARILKGDGRLITCNKTADCLKYVKEGNFVYSAPIGLLKTILDDDIKSNSGTCQYTITQEEFWSTATYTPLRKNSPYTKSISMGILRMNEAGLFNQWKKWYVPSPSKCMEFNKKTEKPKLSIKHLSSAFVVLFVGCFLSTVVFGIEKILAVFRTK